MFTRGKRPVFTEGTYDDAVHIRKLQHNYRLARPVSMPIEIYQVVLETWHATSKLRPSFSELTNIFDEAGRVPAKYGLSNALKNFGSYKIDPRVKLAGGWSIVGFETKYLIKGSVGYSELVSKSRKVTSVKKKTKKKEPDVYVVTDYVERFEAVGIVEPVQDRRLEPNVILINPGDSYGNMSGKDSFLNSKDIQKVDDDAYGANSSIVPLISSVKKTNV